MTVSVEIEVGRTDDALLVPASAVRAAATDEPYVLVVEGGRATRRGVVIGLRGNDLFAVEDGLTEGDSLIAGEVRDVADGDRVRAETATEEQ
jgi:HlyD family secretion protein